MHYCDITGETDFFRANIEKYHLQALEKRVCIVSHCGNDCIPWDATVHGMWQFAKEKGYTLQECRTFTDLPATAAMSGGTTTTALYQLGKKRDRKGGPEFDPLLKTDKGDKSQFSMNNISPKTSTFCPEHKRNAGPWIMGPVMVNCVRRSNALVGYAESLTFSEAMLDPEGSFYDKMKQASLSTLMGAAFYVPPLRVLLPQPGEGPSKDDMEAGWLKVHGHGVMKKGEETCKIKSTFTFTKDTGYLQTAHMLVEAAMLLVEKSKSNTCVPGVVTPAVAFGPDIVKRLGVAIGAKLEIEQIAA